MGLGLVFRAVIGAVLTYLARLDYSDRCSRPPIVDRCLEWRFEGTRLESKSRSTHNYNFLYCFPVEVAFECSLKAYIQDLVVYQPSCQRSMNAPQSHIFRHRDVASLAYLGLVLQPSLETSLDRVQGWTPAARCAAGLCYFPNSASSIRTIQCRLFFPSATPINQKPSQLQHAREVGVSRRINLKAPSLRNSRNFG